MTQPLLRRIQTARPAAFTLVEVLVVIAIIALLASLLLPTMDRAREISRRTICAANQREFHIAAVAYTGDYGSFLPWPAKYNNANGVWGNSGCAQNLVWNAHAGVPNNPTGLGQLMIGDPNANFTVTNGKLVCDYLSYLNNYKIGYCPSMDNLSSTSNYRIPGNFQAKAFATDYDYRYNNWDPVSYGMYPGSTYQIDTLNRAPGWLPLFEDSSNYRLVGGLTPRVTSAPGWNERWSHLEGGNVIRFDGSNRWLNNTINASAWNFYGKGVPKLSGAM